MIKAKKAIRSKSFPWRPTGSRESMENIIAPILELAQLVSSSLHGNFFRTNDRRRIDGREMLWRRRIYLPNWTGFGPHSFRKMPQYPDCFILSEEYIVTLIKISIILFRFYYNGTAPPDMVKPSPDNALLYPPNDSFNDTL